VFTIRVTNEQTILPVDAARLRRAVQTVLEDEPIPKAQISVAVVDDPTIHRLNRQYLNHDRPTDVLSFVLERSAGCLEGEVVVSAETAQEAAPRFGWSPADELLLYVIHGTLHLLGHEDQTAAGRDQMQARERTCLARFGLTPRYEESTENGHGSRTAGRVGLFSGETKVP
jgi:probable rRNA maturation factor